MSANENQIPIYVLQPEISGQIKQTTLEEVKNWIKNGDLQPHHQVRIKNLSWVEAQNVPVFQSLFESKKKGEKEQADHFYSQPLPVPSGFQQNKSETILSKETSLSTAETAVKKESKPVEPSAVFKAFEKKALARSKQAETKTEPTESKTKKTGSSKFTPEQSKKSPIIKKTLGFIAGCILMLLLSLGGSYLWVYQLKTPAEIDEKNLPDLAGLEHRLTSDKLDLRLKEAAKQADDQENISQRIAQLEKKYATQSKTAIENHRIKLENADFTATFSFSSAVMLALFFVGRIFYGKTSEPVKQKFPSKSSAPQTPELSEIAGADVEALEVEFSENTDTKVSSEENDEPPAEENPAKSSDIDENDKSEKSTSDRCLLHREKLSVSVCEACDTRFCDECFKSFGEPENSCPFCKAICKTIAANTNKPSAEEKKKTNLLDLGKDSDFIVYEYEVERSRIAGVIQALVIALFISAAVSILWVYKISPYLENRKQETAQNISPNESKNPEQANSSSAETAANTEATDDKPCIDPETRQPFECNAETRRALFEHTRKVESVEKAQKDVDAKTKLLTNSTSEDSSSENAERKAAEEKRRAFEKRQLITAFLISFVTIFSILLSIIFLGKDKKTFLARDDPAES